MSPHLLFWDLDCSSFSKALRYTIKLVIWGLANYYIFNILKLKLYYQKLQLKKPRHTKINKTRRLSSSTNSSTVRAAIWKGGWGASHWIYAFAIAEPESHCLGLRLLWDQSAPCGQESTPVALEVSSGPELWLQCAQHPLRDKHLFQWSLGLLQGKILISTVPVFTAGSGVYIAVVPENTLGLWL